ncbi:MAG: hypothetical protein ACKOZU_09960 [Planctomycetaceae bacterium]
MSLRLPASPSCRAVRAGMVVAAGLSFSPAAHAQRGRTSAAQRAAMQRMQQQMQAYQKELADKNAEILKQYDENGDGRLLGPEKSKCDKYMFEVQKDRQPNPFAGIVPPGQGTETAAAGKKK